MSQMERGGGEGEGEGEKEREREREREGGRGRERKRERTLHNKCAIRRHSSSCVDPNSPLLFSEVC